MASSLFGTQNTVMANPAVNNQQTPPTDPMQIKAMLRNSSNPRAVVESLANQGNKDAQIALCFKME